MDCDVLIGKPGGLGPDGIDDNKAGTIATGLNDEGPQMDVGREDVRTPGHNELGMLELFRLCAQASVHGRHQTSATGRRANGTVQARRTETVEETAVHPRAIEHAHRAGV